MRIADQKTMRQYLQDHHPMTDPEEQFKNKDVAHVKADSIQGQKIKQDILEMQKWEAHVKSHELAHAIVGGGNISSASYVYAYGPDGKKYAYGGVVSVRIPKGLTQESVDQLSRLKRATSASVDASPQDLYTASIISAEEHSRARMLRLKEAIQKYEKQLSQSSLNKIKDGDEIFHYKKINFHSYRIMELFV
ncbi:MAG: hypothetical protein JXR88_13480 [Clostridia bacterium]|nr:hypothetical protein [Clostridia bacterium]